MARSRLLQIAGIALTFSLATAGQAAAKSVTYKVTPPIHTIRDAANVAATSALLDGRITTAVPVQLTVGKCRRGSCRITYVAADGTESVRGAAKVVRRGRIVKRGSDGGTLTYRWHYRVTVRVNN